MGSGFRARMAREAMKLWVWLVALALLAIISRPAAAESITIYNVTMVDVADGTREHHLRW